MTRQMMCACAFLVTCSTVFAADLYVPANPTRGGFQLLRLLDGDPTSPVVVGNTGVELAGMAYDPRSDEFVAHGRTGNQMYRVNRYTGATTAFPNSLPSLHINGFVYVPTVDEIYVATEGASGQDDQIARLLPDGTLDLLFDLSSDVIDLDSMTWNPITSEFIATDKERALAHVIDPATGAVIETRSIDTSIYEIGTGSINPDDGLYYTIAIPGINPSAMNTFDLNTGAHVATLGSIPNVSTLGGLAFVPEPATLLTISVVLIALRRRN